MTSHYVDRSRIEVGHTCQRKRFWNYHFAGRGVTPVADKPDLEYGLAVHEHIEDLTVGSSKPFRSINTGNLDTDHEWLALYQGHCKVFKDYVLPKILSEYDWIASELEITMPLSADIAWATRLDGVLRRKSDGLYFVLEAKTSGHLDSLLKQSSHNFQLLMECEALRYYLCEKYKNDRSYRDECGRTSLPTVGGALLLVFDKGRKSKVTRDGQTVGYRRMSPFTYVYNKYGEWSLDYKKGWILTPTWELNDWLGFLEHTWPQVMKSTVQLWPGVSFDPDMVESVKRQVLHNEHRLSMYSYYAKNDPEQNQAALVDAYFSQNFSACHNQYGKDCDYLATCFSPTVARDPIASELYEWRVPNHPCEVTDENH